VKGIQVCSNKGPGPLLRGDNHKNVKMGWGHLKISRTTGPILTRLVINHPWVEGIQVCSNEGDCPSSRGDNSKRVKILLKEEVKNVKVYRQTDNGQKAIRIAHLSFQLR
jgi:hypothetical protein